MVILDSFRRGLLAATTKPALRSLVWSYAAVLVVGVLALLPMFAFVSATVAGSTMARDLRNGQYSDWLVDLAGAEGIGPSLWTLLVVAVLIVPVYLLLVVGLSGGVLVRLKAALGIRASDQPFLSACGEFAGPLFRLALVELGSVVVVAIVLMIVRVAVGAIGLGPLVSWVWLALTLVTLILVTSLFDYARVRLVLSESAASWQALASASRFAMRRAPAVLGLAALNTLVACSTLVTFLWLHSLVGLDTREGVLLGVVTGQLSVVARLWCRIAAYASEMALWSADEH